LLDPILRHFRLRRMRRFAREFAITNGTRILDVGGTPFNWSLLQARPRVTIVNMPRAREAFDEQFSCVFADGRRLPFGDRSFDIVLSSPIRSGGEHSVGHRNTSQFSKKVARPREIWKAASWVAT